MNGLKSDLWCGFSADTDSSACLLRPGAGSYNSVKVENGTTHSSTTAGVPSCANGLFNNGILRSKWGFDGLLVSDCTAISDFTAYNSKCKSNCQPGHNFSASNISAVAAAMAGGTDTNCGNPNFFSRYLRRAVAEGLVPQTRVDSAFRRVMRSILRLGLLDVGMPYDQLRKTDVGTAATDKLCIEAAQQAVVVLAGSEVLPLAPLAVETASWALIGPHANTTTELLGMYVGAGNQRITDRSAHSVLSDRLGSAQLVFAPGLPSLESTDTSGFGAAVAAATRSAVSVVMLGLCEQGHGCREHENQDRSTLGLPATQLALLKAVAATNTTAVCVFISGGPLTVDALDELCDTALWSGYPGQAGAIGIVDVLLGVAAPTGRLPYTLHHQSFTAARPMTSMAVRPQGLQLGATYRWLGGVPVLRPFGFGLSLAHWSWSWASPAAPRTLPVAVVVAAAKQRAAVFSVAAGGLRLQAPSDGRLAAAGTDSVGASALGFVEAVDGEGRQLFGFAKLEPVLVGQSGSISLPLKALSLTTVHSDGSRWVVPGRYNITIDAGDATGLATVLLVTGDAEMVEESPF